MQCIQATDDGSLPMRDSLLNTSNHGIDKSLLTPALYRAAAQKQCTTFTHPHAAETNKLGRDTAVSGASETLRHHFQPTCDHTNKDHASTLGSTIIVSQ